MPKLVALILTYNEEAHIKRCISSIKNIVDEIVVVDSFSTDSTTKILKSLNIEYYQNNWKNYASQFVYGASHINQNDYILRIDADEYCDEELLYSIETIKTRIDKFDGYYVNRWMTFIRSPISFGGVFPTEMLRIYKNSSGTIESRWMDEHIVLNAKTASTQRLKGKLIDDSLKSLSWWINKHNGYASREAVDVLLQKYGFEVDSIAKKSLSSEAGFKRFLKESVYNHLPFFVGPTLYFCYRYFVRLGFLDGVAGFNFHFFQGFWYRFLVNSKVSEVENFMKHNNVELIEAINEILAINLNSKE